MGWSRPLSMFSDCQRRTPEMEEERERGVQAWSWSRCKVDGETAERLLRPAQGPGPRPPTVYGRARPGRRHPQRLNDFGFKRASDGVQRAPPASPPARTCSDIRVRTYLVDPSGRAVTLNSGLGRPGMAEPEYDPLATRAYPQTRTQESIHPKRQFKSAQISAYLFALSSWTAQSWAVPPRSAFC